MLRRTPSPSLSERLEDVALRSMLSVVGALPRTLARRLGETVGRVCYHVFGRLRRVGMRNLEIAFPAWSQRRKSAVLHASFLQLGRHLAEFCRMTRYTAAEATTFIRYDGLDRYLDAARRGKGVLVLTGHLGAWELSSFFHSLMGYPMGMVIRRLDNAIVDRRVNEVRCQHGNRVLHKDDFARSLLTEMRAGRTVGILMDTNMTPPQGVFVPFFGKLACTASGLARVAQKTGAAVLPGFLFEETGGRYRLHFGEEIPLQQTDDSEADTLANTARFTAVLEQYIRSFPEQWLWMHRRWKTRPVTEARIY